MLGRLNLLNTLTLLKPERLFNEILGERLQRSRSRHPLQGVEENLQQQQQQQRHISSSNKLAPKKFNCPKVKKAKSKRRIEGTIRGLNYAVVYDFLRGQHGLQGYLDEVRGDAAEFISLLIDELRDYDEPREEVSIQ
ncbi:hypothetical protein K470DRAFT_269294 [Piedraia hortae CBS 480.64]|uniref:Uncharacterized protein n=1 Tax=Piedraia hortae CBS 480.64 TaxID=1314780 RepID=A0A6A7C3F4_9PEZI|nr:hypothetical protein K470DRAFT_269294 [Piedraia hortae CBS 480.64]